jgi:hypothetical protein
VSGPSPRREFAATIVETSHAALFLERDDLLVEIVAIEVSE